MLYLDFFHFEVAHNAYQHFSGFLLLNQCYLSFLAGTIIMELYKCPVIGEQQLKTPSMLAFKAYHSIPVGVRTFVANCNQDSPEIFDALSWY